MIRMYNESNIYFLNELSHLSNINNSYRTLELYHHENYRYDRQNSSPSKDYMQQAVLQFGYN